MKHILSLSCFFFWASLALAESNCDYIKREFPDRYNATCGSGGAGGVKPASASSTFSEGFNVTPAALPTEPSSYGIEVIGSFLLGNLGDWSPTFSIVKGFHKFGTGISTSGQNIFYGNDVVGRVSEGPLVTSFEPTETAKSSYPNLNLGTSWSVLDIKNGPQFVLGVSLRHNKITDTWGGGPGLVMNWKRFTLGGGFTREQVSNYLPTITFASYVFSVRISLLELEYNRLQSFGGPALTPIHIFTATLHVNKLLLTAALREVQYYSSGTVYQPHFAFQYSLSRHVSCGMLYNYIPGAISLATQVLL